MQKYDMTWYIDLKYVFFFTKHGLVYGHDERCVWFFIAYWRHVLCYKNMSPLVRNIDLNIEELCQNLSQGRNSSYVTTRPQAI